MKKLQSIIVLSILILTIFSSFNFLPSASANPPLTGNKAFANASVSYTDVSETNSATNQATISATANTTYTNLEINVTSNWAVNSTSAGTMAWLNLTNATGIYVYTGTVLHINATQSYAARSNNNKDYDLGTEYVYLTVGSTEYQTSYVYNAWGTADFIVVFSPYIAIKNSGTIQNLSFKESADTAVGYNFESGAPPSHCWTETGFVGNTTLAKSSSNIGAVVSVPFVEGWSYTSSVSSSFSSLVPSNTYSYSIFWSAQYSSTATYNSNAYTSSPITGVLNVYTISFASSTAVLDVTSYTASYYLNLTLTNPASSSYSIQSYIYSISHTASNYFNSSFIYFNYTVPSSALTSYSASYSIHVSNLTLTNPSAPVDQLSLNSQDFTYYSLSRYGNTYNVTAYKNYSTAQNANTKFSTSETVNYYPTLNYNIIKWTGTGSEAELEINATTIGGGYTFSGETIQILNINWGDGSPLQSSSEQSGQHNWTLYHYYQTTGSYSVSYQIENWVGGSDSLSITKTLSYTVSVGITTSPLNNAKLSSGESIFFNWSDTNAGMQSVSLSIDSIVQQTNSYSSQLSGSVSFKPTYLGSLSVSWHCVAGNISGYQNLTYTTSSTVAETGLYVIANFTLDSQSYSNYYYYSQISPYNLTWSYFTWNVQLPNGSTLSSIKGNDSWLFQSAFPGLYVYYTGNSSVHFYEKSTYYQVVWLAPLPPSFGYFSIKLEDAAGNTIGSSGASFQAYDVYVNNHPASSDIVNGQTGETYNVKVYSEPFNELLSNSNFTIQYQTSEDVIRLPVYPLAVDNLNQTYFALFSVGQNGVTENISFVGMGQTVDYSIAAGTYYLNFSLWGQNGNTGLRVSKLTTISGPSIQWISGLTLAQVSSQIKNQTTLIENVNLTLVSQGASIKNQTINIQVSVKNLNDTIGTQLSNFNVSLQAILSTVDHSNVSLSEKVQYVDSLINASSYKLIPGSPTLNGENYSYPIQVIDSKTSLPANLSITEQAAKNLQAQLVNSIGAIAIPYSVYDVRAGKFYLTLVLNASQVGAIRSGGYISMFGAIGGPVSSSVAGKISSSNLPGTNFNSIQGIIGFLGNLEQTTYGRALYLITGLVALMYYIVVLTRRNEKKAKRR